MPPLMIMMKPSSSMCNMTCKYCFYCDEAEKRTVSSYGFMTEETLKNVIRRTLPVAEGQITYAFQGGEPTLRGLAFFETVIAYEKQYNRKNIAVANALQTNGYGINEDWCRFFKEHGFLVGLSVDGTEAIHDMYRQDKSGQGTYQRVLRAAQLIDEYQVPYNILTVVTAPLARNIRQVYEDYRKKGWAYQQYIACLDSLEGDRGKEEYSLTPDLYGQFLIELFRLWHQDYKKGRQPYIRQFENYIGLAMGYTAEACDQRGTCGIQNVVEADGSVYPCDFYMLDEYRLGNFNTDRLEQIDGRRREIRFLERSLKLDEGCLSCKHYSLCRGGCQRNRDYLPASGKYRNYLCESYRMFFEACGEEIEEIAKGLQSRK